jgi:antirestriction protein ArdC
MKGAVIMKIAELYETVTARIIGELERGATPWVKPWRSGRGTVGGTFLPYNAGTGRPYSGVNVLILWDAAERRGYTKGSWLTFRQANDLGGSVRKGERGIAVVFIKRLARSPAGADDTEDDRPRTVLRTFRVFNLAQIDGLPEEFHEQPKHPHFSERYAAAATLVQATGARIEHGGNRACFIPALDLIALPPVGSFTSDDTYYATALHELGHWSGAKERLDRDLTGRFGSRAYAAEELVAELVSAFLCAHLGITGELRHAAYIGDWLALLRDDSRAIFTAASKASLAADYLRRFSEKAPPAESAAPDAAS